jgi:dipeptidyl aminopeptidase/acylaminoacyl peptidase
MTRIYLFAFLFIFSFAVKAQDDGSYKMPPKDIADMLLVKPTPSVSINDKGEWMLQMQGTNYPPVEELAKPEYRIAGLRINPANFSPSRQNYIVSLTLTQISSGKSFPVTGLPSPLYAGNVRWSPGDNKIAFTNTAPGRIDLYVIDIATKKATKINSTALNTIMGTYSWIDNNSLLYRAIVKPAVAAPVRPLTPKGPAVQENYGKASPRPTYQDMIKSPFDESLFAFFATTQLVRNTNGVETKIGAPSIYKSVAVSPNKEYMLMETVKKPFSYLVPAYGFPSIVSITNKLGKQIKVLATLPGSETAPSGNDNVQNVARGFDWRDDAPATIIWAMPLDSGMIKKPSTYRDAVYALNAPFTGDAKELFKTTMRYGGITWGNDNIALVTEYLRSKQSVQVDTYNPTTGALAELMKRNTTDAYGNPGSPLTVMNQYGKDVLQFVGKDKQTILYNNTTGSSPRGDLPFLMSYNFATKASDTLWRSQPGFYEMIVKVIDPEKLTIITRKESKTDVPNYWMKNLRLRIADQKLTAFADPYPQMEGVTKEKIKYQRADGVTLTGDLYLPKGFRPGVDKPLPVFIWAYPAEYNSAADAGQVRGSEDRFTYVGGGSPVFYVTHGYAVLNNAEMPIVATGADKKPNDDFVEQLTLNAEAAIKKLSDMGVGDKNRMAVGGHSYGAFMTANLLAHTNLFKAGIARSGAYNRSLTPFGFQNEDRTYWQDTKLYTEMSPFSYADKIKTPLLLIHGEMDNNTGTYPIQSERLFNAIKGLGGTVRYVSLPFESHGYSGRENVLQVLAEQLEWLDKYVK